MSGGLAGTVTVGEDGRLELAEGPPVLSVQDYHGDIDLSVTRDDRLDLDG